MGFLRNALPLYGTEWEQYRPADGYDKVEYDIMLKDGRIITNCYPNAGYFNPMGKNAIKSTYRTGGWSSEEVDKIRITPYDQQKLHINEDELYGK